MKIAVIGCGAVFEAFYLDALRKMQAEGLIDVVLLVDNLPGNLKSAHRSFPKAKTASDLCTGLSYLSIDRAIVLTPPATHAPIMLELAEAGIHVYCEKPLTVSPTEAKTIAETFASKNLICKVGYVRRLFPNFQAFRSMYSNLGSNRDLSVSDGEVFRWPIKTGSIFSPIVPGGGVVWDKLSHNLDIIQWTAGLRTIDRVQSSCKTGRVPVNILVEGNTNHGKFRIAVSWTEGFANVVSANDGTHTIESKNGLTHSLRVSSTGLSSPNIKMNATSYDEAVQIALRDFFKLRDNKETSILATAEESVILTEFLAHVDMTARTGAL